MAVTVTYNVRGGVSTVVASTTAPTAAQAAQVQKQSATVVFGADSDTQAVFTHNWGLDVSAPGYLEPEILYYRTSLPATFADVTFDITSTNVVKINKANAAGSAQTLVVVLRRPFSMVQ